MEKGLTKNKRDHETAPNEKGRVELEALVVDAGTGAELLVKIQIESPVLR